MKRRLIPLLLAAMLLGASALAEGVLFTGTVSKKMTIRETRSTSGRKLGEVFPGEFLQILEYGEKWTRILAGGGEGYILSKNVENLTAAGGYNDEAEAAYEGTAEQQLTVREQKKRTARKMQTLEAGETVYILAFEGEWLSVVKQGVHGFVIASSVRGIRSLREGIEVPDEYRTPPVFEARFTAVADLKLHIRKKPDTGAASGGMVLEDETVEVMQIEDGWAYVRKGKDEGYVPESHLKHYRKTDPYGPLIPGTRAYPSAALVQEDTAILDAGDGSTLFIATSGTVFAIDEPARDGSATLPFHRTTGKVSDVGTLWLEEVVLWSEAQPGELLAVYSTFYDAEAAEEIQQGRVFNIEEGVRRINGTVVAPDEVFSFNALCAPYTKGNGYRLGPIINYVSSQKTGYSGGICQVSTTLYNAALQIPFEVMRQQPHSSYGVFYVPVDLDAAVGAGNLDLKLRNALPYPVRIDCRAEDGVLSVRLYRGEDKP